jgi:hypothetical protein
MKKILLPLILLLAGLGVGGGAAYGTSRLVGPRAAASANEEVDTSEMGFVTSTKVTAPLVTPDGRLSGYVAFEVSLQVPRDKSESVTARLPLFLHAVNMRTYRTPMAAGPDGLLPDLGTFRKVVMDSAAEAFGPRVVHFAAITQALPA